MTDLRADIITRYHDRLAAGKRTKLTQNELNQLINLFVERLQGLKTQRKIKALCEAEIALLAQGYPEESIAKNQLPQYRKAILAAIESGHLTLSTANSTRYPYTNRDGETVEAHDHWGFFYMKLPKDRYLAHANASAERNNHKQDALKPVNPDAYLAKTAELLHSNDPFELAVGIAAATGRRFSEVVDKGTLQPTHHPDWVSFSGQLKKQSGEAGSYLTPCLLPAADVLAAIDRFRHHPRISRVAGETTKGLNRSLASSIKRVVQQQFGQSGIVPILEGEADVSIHNLRGVYGEICVHFFCPPSRGVARFVQERLGHVISEQELKRGNSTATQHYFHYYLVDANGKHIGSKGVKLLDVDGEALPTLTEPIPKTLTEPLAESQLDQQPSTHMVSFAAPTAIATLTEQVSTLTQEMHRLWSHVQEMNTQSPQTLTATDTTFFTREIETLRVHLTTLEQERNQAAAELEQVKLENESLLQQFNQERQVYQQRIEGLTNLLKQTPPTAQTPLPSVETPATETQQVAVPTPQIQPAMPPVQPLQSKPRREHTTKPGSADQRVEAAMRAIMEWNRHHNSDSEKFAITQSLLQKTTGSNMPAVKRVMEVFQNQIYEHNSEYGLDPDRHNYGRDFQEIKAWVQSKL